MGQHYAIKDDEFEEFRRSGSLHIIYDTRGSSVTFIEYFCCCLYAKLFLFGLASNFVVLRTLITVLRYRARIPSGNGSNSAHNSILIYLVSMCIVNVLVLSALPLTIADIGTGEWRLPRFLCSIYWICEIMNKIMTSVISASFSLSCYFSVCRFNVTQMYKSSLVAALIVAAGLALTFWQAYQAIKYADVFHIGEEIDNTTFAVKGQKCLFHPVDMDETTKFTISTILCGYGLPSLSMILCYAAILKKIFQQSRAVSNRISSRFRRTIVSVAIVIIFYLATWSPYWIIVLTLNALNDDVASQRMLSKCAVVVHLLPFLNSAFSPIVYVFLNRDIRKHYELIRKSSKNRKDTTTGVNGLVHSYAVVGTDRPVTITPTPRSV